MFGKKKKAKKNENLMKKAPAAGAMELGDDVLEAAAGGVDARRVMVFRGGRIIEWDDDSQSYAIKWVDAYGRLQSSVGFASEQEALLHL